MFTAACLGGLFSEMSRVPKGIELMFFGMLVVLRKISEENLVKSSTEKWQIIFDHKLLTSTRKQLFIKGRGTENETLLCAWKERARNIWWRPKHFYLGLWPCCLDSSTLFWLSHNSWTSIDSVRFQPNNKALRGLVRWHAYLCSESSLQYNNIVSQILEAWEYDWLHHLALCLSETLLSYFFIPPLFLLNSWKIISLKCNYVSLTNCCWMIFHTFQNEELWKTTHSHIKLLATEHDQQSLMSCDLNLVYNPERL